MVVVVVVVRRRIREEELVVDDDGEDPFPKCVAFSLLPPFAFPFRPDRLFKENLGEEEAESAVFIVVAFIEFRRALLLFFCA